MIYRRLGNSGLHVSALGLGGWLTFGGQVENGMWHLYRSPKRLLLPTNISQMARRPA